MALTIPQRGRARTAAHGPPSRLLLDTGTVCAGRFAIHPDHPEFAEAGQPRRHVFVFPRTDVWIEHRGQRPFIADRTTVTYYNRADAYRRGVLDCQGDRCDWYAVEPGTLTDLVRAMDPSVEERPDRPFAFTHGPADPVSYARQRLVAHHLANEAVPDALLVEETMLQVLQRVLGLAYARLGMHRAARPKGSGVDLVERVRCFALPRLDERLTLARLARTVGCTPFHLSHTFRAVTGGTVHGWLLRLRLQASLERVAEPDSDLTAIALDLGFASHRHVTEAFRKAFGVTPSVFRRCARSSRVAVLAAGPVPRP